MKFSKKHALLISVVAVLMALCTVAGATLAYLFTKTNDVVNTFSPSNITLTLEETPVAGGSSVANSYQMIPGTTITKDPKVTVTTNLACYVFVKIEKSANFDSFMEYAVADGWTALSGEDGVYYREVASASGTVYPVIEGNTVTVKSTVLKSDMATLTSESAYPTLTFTAYAVQKAGFATVATAWSVAKAQANP